MVYKILKILNIRINICNKNLKQILNFLKDILK